MNTAQLLQGGPDASATLHERRDIARRAYRVSVLVHATGLPPMKGRTIDVSPAGVALLLPRALQPGSKAKVAFTIHADGALQHIGAEVEVTNCVFLSSDIRVGCRFTSLAEETRKLLAAFVR